MLNPADLAEILRAHPYPGVTDLVIEDGDLNLTFEGATVPLDGELWRLDGVGVRFDVDGWNTCGLTVRSHLSAAPTPDAVHAEIALVLRLAAKTPESPARRDRRLTDEMDRRRDMEQALAKVTTERNALLVAESTLSKIAAALAIPALEPHDDALSMVRRLVDGYTVVSQRLAGSQKEVAEVTKRVTKAEARVKRLLRQRAAAHAVLDEAAIGLEPEGSPRWTLARRCRAAVEPVWDHLDALQAFDVVGESVGVTGKTGERGFMDAVIARVKALHQAYTTLAALLFADHSDPAAVVKALHALNNRIKVYEVTEEQWEADNATSVDLERLVNYHQAPIRFADRPLTLAERAIFVIRRLWQGRTNAANEAAALRRELGDIADALGDLPDTAEREPIGDREEHLGLSTAERIRLSR